MTGNFCKKKKKKQKNGKLKRKKKWADKSDEYKIYLYESKKKSHGIGFLISWFVPGGAHFYADENEWGIFFLGTELSLYSVIMYNYVRGIQKEINDDESSKDNMKTADTLFIIAIIIHAWQLIDAQVRIGNYNKRLMEKLGLSEVDLSLQLLPHVSPVSNYSNSFLADTGQDRYKIDGLNLAFQFKY